MIKANTLQCLSLQKILEDNHKLCYVMSDILSKYVLKCSIKMVIKGSVCANVIMT